MKNEPNKKYGWGGARPYSGRRQKTGAAECMTLSAHVPKSLVDDLKEAASEEGVSLSSKITEILTNWINSQCDEATQPDPSPDALAAAVNRLADVIEKIVNRNEED
jgi:hypothetical protein